MVDFNTHNGSFIKQLIPLLKTRKIYEFGYVSWVIGTACWLFKSSKLKAKIKTKTVANIGMLSIVLDL